MNVNVTCCTVADSAGAVLAEVTVMFTFVPSHKQIGVFVFLPSGGCHGKTTLTRNNASELHYIQRSTLGGREGGREGAGNGDLHGIVGRAVVGGGLGFALSPRPLSPQPSARRRTIHSLITCQSLHPKLALYWFICWGLSTYFFFFLALSVASEINSHSRLELKGRMGRKEQNNWMEKCAHGSRCRAWRSDLGI